MIKPISNLFRKSNVYWVIGIFLLYLLINVMFSGFYTTFQLIIRYAGTVNWLKLGISIILTIVIGFLVSMNAVLWYIRYKERKECASGGTLATLGTAGGLITGVCPLCVVGLVPLVLSALGITFSFATLPFGGIEVQVLIVILLGASFKILTR